MKINPLHVFTLILFFSIPVYVLSQSTGTIKGFVRDAANGESLPYANVYLKGTQLGSSANEQGYYVISRIPPGSYTLVFSMMGYGTVERNVTVSIKGITENASLETQVFEFDTIVKTAKRERFEREVEISTQTLQPREFAKMPSLAEADLFRTLQFLPGVVSQSDFSSQLYVRGGSPDQNLILLDGVVIYNPFHLGGVFSTFNVDAIKEVEFMTGGFPAEYGGRLSSVLNITNREGNNKRFTGKGNISLLSAKTTMEGPAPRGSWLLSARRTYFDQIFKGSKYEFPYYFYDLNGKANIDISEEHRITISGFYGDDVLDFNFDDDTSDVDVSIDWLWGNRTTSVKWRYIISPTILSELLLTRSHFRNNVDLDVQMSSGLGSLDINNSIVDLSAKNDFTYFGIPKHEIRLGFNYSRLDFKYFIGLNDLSLMDYRTKSQFLSLYLQDQWRASALLSFKTGMRLNYYDLGRHWRLAPRFGFKYRLQENLALKGSWGVYYQFLNTANSEEENFSFMDLWFPLTRQYQPLRATHYVAGIEWWLPHDLTLTTELYYKDMANLLLLNERGDFADPDDDFFVGPGWATGMEILLKRSIGRLNGWLGYSLSATKRDIAAVRFYPKYDRRHSFNLVLNYDLGRRWTFNFLWTYGSGFPYTPVLGKYWHHEYDFVEKELDSEIHNIKGEKNSRRYPAYHRMDMSLSKKWQPFGLFTTLYLQVINVYNRKNVFFYFWDHDQNPSQLETVTMFPFLPTLGINFEF
jgi:hypothetical protein